MIIRLYEVLKYNREDVRIEEPLTVNYSSIRIQGSTKGREVEKFTKKDTVSGMLQYRRTFL